MAKYYLRKLKKYLLDKPGYIRNTLLYIILRITMINPKTINLMKKIFRKILNFLKLIAAMFVSASMTAFLYLVSYPGRILIDAWFYIILLLLWLAPLIACFWALYRYHLFLKEINGKWELDMILMVILIFWCVILVWFRLWFPWIYEIIDLFSSQSIYWVDERAWLIKRQEICDYIVHKYAWHKKPEIESKDESDILEIIQIR
jgi:hypothetical protein